MNPLERSMLVGDLATQMHQHGSWCGETHLQKSQYFLQELLAVPSGFRFILYKHGPYSYDLHDELIEMQSNGLVELKVHPRPYGPSLVPTEAYRKIRESLGIQTLYADRVEFVARHLGPRGVTALERLSTALYVERENPGTSEEGKAERIHELKPHIPLVEARRAIAELNSLKTELPVQMAG